MSSLGGSKGSDENSAARTWEPGHGGAPWLCALGLHPRPKKHTDRTCPACGRELVR